MQAGSYDNAAAALEMGVESLAGGIPGFGKGVLDDIIKGFERFPAAARGFLNMLGEGGEEALTSFVTPYLQRIFYNPEARNATVKELLTDFAYGAALSGIMQGTQVVGDIVGGKRAGAAEQQAKRDALTNAYMEARARNRQIADAVDTLQATQQEIDKPSDGLYNEDAGNPEMDFSSNKKKISFKSLDDFFDAPEMFGDTTPEQLYNHLKNNEFNPLPLSDGRLAGKSFTEGGGYKINWGGDRILEYHPAGLNHHGGRAYYKLSSGPTGKMWFDIWGNPLT
jgi:hypothetical protein